MSNQQNTQKTTGNIEKQNENRFKKLRRTKIFSTLGPASNNLEAIKSIISSGANAVRMNFSHGTFESHSALYNMVRKVSEELGREIAVMVDLQGPKIRCNEFENGFITLNEGENVKIVYSDEKGKDGIITTTFKPMIQYGKVGERILLDDGYLQVVVSQKTENELICTVVQGGKLKDRKGINLPETDLGDESAISEKDLKDVEYAINNFDIDFFALSFTRRAQDVIDLRKHITRLVQAKIAKRKQLLQEQKQQSSSSSSSSSSELINISKEEDNYGISYPLIYAKVERPEALSNLDSILSVTDGVLMARGDLAVEIGSSSVPLAQKTVVKRCREKRVAVCVCTQMLETMTTKLLPSRAECTDVTNAVIDGSDAVMLSGETAVGEHPSSAVSMMSSLLSNAELSLSYSQTVQDILLPQLSWHCFDSYAKEQNIPSALNPIFDIRKMDASYIISPHYTACISSSSSSSSSSSTTINIKEGEKKEEHLLKKDEICRRMILSDMVVDAFGEKRLRQIQPTALSACLLAGTADTHGIALIIDYSSSSSSSSSSSHRKAEEALEELLALEISAQRPACPVFVFTLSSAAARMLTIVSGCFPILLKKEENEGEKKEKEEERDEVKKAMNEVLKKGYVENGETLVTLKISSERDDMFIYTLNVN